MRILIVDDEPAVLRAEIRMLEAAGHSCRGGSTVDEARALLTSETFEVAILDIHIGSDNGLDLAREMLRSHPDIPVIMVTGAQDFASVSQARIAGAIDYLVKPMSGDAIRQAVDRASALRQRRGKPADVSHTPRPPKATPPAPPVTVAREGEPPIDRLFREMARRKASDLHLSTGSPPQIRRDGAMEPLEPGGEALTAEQVADLLRPIIPGRNLSEFDQRHDSDFAYEMEGVGRFRANVFLDRRGMGAVFRKVPTSIMTVEDLELSPAILEFCALRKGLVLVTGPTGSGKSTTLAAMIDYINRTRADHIVTIEDPIEFVHDNRKCLVNQREVGSHTQSFRAALRAALREDPDVVLIGEMRDLETVAIALETAETGHLVFGTLHTTTAASTVDRIIDQFPAAQQSQIRVMLSESLRGVVAQTLCRRIGGGRVAAHEVLVVTTAIANLIRQGKSFQIPSMMQVSAESGMVMLDDALQNLVKRRMITAEEARLHAVDKAIFGGT